MFLIKGAEGLQTRSKHPALLKERKQDFPNKRKMQLSSPTHPCGKRGTPTRLRESATRLLRIAALGFGGKVLACTISSGDIDVNNVSVGEHRDRLARRDIKAWLQSAGLPYHSPHKFRHGHIHFGLRHSTNIEDYKAVSLNVMHSSMKITDEFYSNLNEDEVRERIGGLGDQKSKSAGVELDGSELIREFLIWREGRAK